MSKETIIPRLGDLHRALIKAAGYRPHIVQIGQDKDLDDLANEDDERQGNRVRPILRRPFTCENHASPA